MNIERKKESVHAKLLVSLEFKPVKVAPAELANIKDEMRKALGVHAEVKREHHRRVLFMVAGEETYVRDETGALWKANSAVDLSAFPDFIDVSSTLEILSKLTPPSKRLN